MAVKNCPIRTDRFEVQYLVDLRVQAMIRDSKKINAEQFFAWAFLTLGITQKTAANYLHSLEVMEMIKIDQEKNEIRWL